MRRVVALTLLAAVLAVACDGDPPSRRRRPRPSTTTSSSTTTTTFPAAAGECGLHGGYRSPWEGRPRYRVRLDVDPVGGVVTGRMTAEWTPPVTTDRLVFRLWANTPRALEGGGNLAVTEVEVRGGAVEAAHEPTTLTLRRPRGDFEAGVPLTADLRFRLDMPGAVNERVAQVGDSLRLGSVLPMLSWIRGRGWHTAPGVNAFSEAVASEVADYDVRVRVPEGFTTLATGRERSPGRFVASGVRDWAATVGRLELAEARAQGGQVRIVVGSAEGSGDDPAARAQTAAAALDGFAARYGPLPWRTLSIGITPSLSGGIEFPQHLHLGTGTSNDHLVHEVAHMWFYALVGNDQYEHPWLDEGLTEYAETRHLGTTASVAAGVAPEGGAGHLGESHAYWADRIPVFFRSVYLQGVSALAAVAETAGGLDAVDCALRRYVLANAHTVAEPADLVRALRRQTGVDPLPALAPFGAP